MEKSQLLKNWKIAAADFGFKIQAPYKLFLKNGVEINAKFLVSKFGTFKGMLIVTNYKDISPFIKEIIELGYGFSVLREPKKDIKYDKNNYIEVLKDRGML